MLLFHPKRVFPSSCLNNIGCSTHAGCTVMVEGMKFVSRTDVMYAKEKKKRSIAKTKIKKITHTPKPHQLQRNEFLISVYHLDRYNYLRGT
jgi:hypothetical protein